MKPLRDAAEASQALEATLLRQMLQDSKVFSGGKAAGSELYGGMFVDALADAVEKAGGIGLARLVERSLPGTTDEAGGTAADAARDTNVVSALNAESVRADLLIRRRPENSKGEGP